MNVRKKILLVLEPCMIVEENYSRLEKRTNFRVDVTCIFSIIRGVRFGFDHLHSVQSSASAIRTPKY